MMMMRTGRIPEGQAVEGAVLAMAMTMTTARVRRTLRVVRNDPGKGRVQRMERGKGRGKRRVRQRRKGRGRETVKEKVLLNKPQEEMISLVPLLCCCRRNCIRHTRTQRANQSGYL
jgi:hypothetical protein